MPPPTLFDMHQTRTFDAVSCTGARTILSWINQAGAEADVSVLPQVLLTFCNDCPTVPTAREMGCSPTTSSRHMGSLSRTNTT